MHKIAVVIGVILLLAGCAPQPPSVLPYANLPAAGDATRGEILFNQQNGLAPACSSCHNDTSTGSAPLDGFGALAATRVEGQSAHEYAFYSIVEPWRYIVEGFGDAMYNQYDERLTAQDIADLIAYILQL